MINKAAQFIQNGGVVAFATETVYGLGADATNNEACQKIFRAKNRPAINPLIVHIATIEQAMNIGEFNENTLKLANAFWPGPLSIVVPLKNTAKIAKVVTANLQTIALRIPSHHTALELIKKSGLPVAAPSANPSGYISGTSLSHVKQHFANNKDIFILELDAYESEYGLESTIIDMTEQPTLLREGFILQENLAEVLGIKVGVAKGLIEIKAPGMLMSHYSPTISLRINAHSLYENEVGLNFGNSNLNGSFSLNLSELGDLREAAKNLYSYLRILDNYALNSNAIVTSIDCIAVAPIPNSGIGLGINDRLRRAAVKC